MKIEVICSFCGKSFLRERKSVNRSKSCGGKIYCSSACQSLGKTTIIELPCYKCGKPLKRTPSQIQGSDSGQVFCSKSCAISVHNTGRESRNYKDGSHLYRSRALAYYGSRCSVCGYDIESVLEVHHKDENRRNGKIENLDVLCPTHHVEYHVGIRNYNTGMA